MAAGILALCISICGCTLKRCSKNYTFQVPFIVSPTNDTISVGDTLWLRANFPKDFIDLNSDEGYRLENFQFYTEFNIGKIDTTVLIDATLDFDYYLTRGSFTIIPLTGGWYGCNVEYEYANGEYLFEMGIIPLTKGNYGFSLSSPTYENLDQVASNPVTNDCEFEKIKIIYQTNQNEDNNYYLFEDSPIPEVNSANFDKYQDEGTYAFVVVE